MTVAQALERPSAKIILLAEITAGIWFRNWIVDGTFTNTYKVTTAREISAVRWNLTTLLTVRTSVALVDANAGSFYWDGATLWVRPPSGSIFTSTVQAVASFYFATQPKVINNRFYDPRLLSAPALSQRIEAVFGGIAQTGGGNITLANSDGFFNAMQDFQWDAGSVVLKLGVDVPNEEMAWADYQTVATWTPESWTRSREEFSVRVIEPKNRLKTKVPFTFYDRTTYANIDDTYVGKPIPLAYGKIFGLEPVLIDPGLKKFKVASHAIREFSAVRLKTSRDQTNTRVVAAASWQLYSGTTYRYYLANEEHKNVIFNTTSLTKVNNVADCVATAGSWTSADNYAYVNPQGGQTIGSGTYTLESSITVTGWTATNFATVDTANAEFTLGQEWAVGTSVSVDMLGKKDGGGNYLGNAIDVISDLLSVIGETNINTSSFTTARARLKLGTDENGSEVFIRSIGVYLNEAKEVSEYIEAILKCAGGYLYTNNLGQVSVAVFRPVPGESLPQIADTDELEFAEETTNRDNASKVNVQFLNRDQDDFLQVYTKERTELQYLHNQAQPVVVEAEENLLTEEAMDVRAWAERFLMLNASPLKQYHVSVAWRGLTWKPGDLFRVKLTRRGIDAVLELLEIKTDLASKKNALTFGNLRGLNDATGFLVADAAVLPAYLSTLAGYGVGSLTWNKNWHADIKKWARNNVGYWTDANGFADGTDPDSFIPSAWI